MADLINSVQNAKVKEARQLLSSANFRKKTGLSVVESPKVIAEIAQLQPERLVFGLRTELAGFADHPSFFGVSDGVFRELSDLGTPQGVLAVVKSQPLLTEVPSSIEWAIALDGVSDPRNLGAILRSVKAFSCPLIALTSDCVDPFHPDVMRVAATNIFPIRMLRLNEITFDHLISRGLVPTALKLGAPALRIDHGFPKRPLFVMGSEGGGIRAPFILNSVHLRAYSIPIHPSVESLNVSVAAGIVLQMFKATEKREG